MNPFTKEFYKNNEKKINEILLDPKITVWIKPTSEFLSILAIGKDPRIKGLSTACRNILLEGNGFAVLSNMVIKWLQGTLDGKNAFVLDNVEIMITSQGSSDDLIQTEIVNVKKDILKEK